MAGCAPPSGGGGGESPTPTADPGPVDIPPASSRAGTAVNAAMSQVGVGYRYAAAEPGVAFDCSGLTMWAWGQAGVGLPASVRRAGRVGGPRAGLVRATGRPDLLLQPDQPRRPVHRWRADGARGELEYRRRRGFGELGQRHRRRPARLASDRARDRYVRLSPPWSGLDGLDLAAVGRWVEANVDGAVGPFEAALIGGGRSNLTYAISGADGRRLVVRRPPLSHVLATAHDVAREFRIISALGPTPVPVPPALALCTDESVNGVPFYVMGFVDGVVLDSPAKADELDPATRTRASELLVDTLADLHDVDIDEVGLGDLAKREGYIERQLRRWRRQWADSKTRELRAIDEVADRLAARIPAQRGAVIAHGDYRFGNCLTDPATGSINAVLDWELCTLGDPLADVGYLGVYWTDPDLAADGPTILRAAVGFRRMPICSSGTPGEPAATCPASTTTSVPVVAAGRDRRGSVRPLPARGDGERGRRRCRGAGADEGGHRAARRRRGRGGQPAAMMEPMPLPR